jgi:ribosomal protein S18 acetylase RimI-like enzyme
MNDLEELSGTRIIPYSNKFYFQTKRLLYSYFDLVNDYDNYLDFLEYSDNRICFLTINKNNDVLGFIDSIIYNHLFRKNDSKLLSLLVEDEFQNQGIGTNMFDRLKVELISSDVSKISVVPSFFATQSNFYEKLGFTDSKLKYELVYCL